MAKTPQMAADKWQRRASAAGQDLTNGVNDVRTAPGTLAAAKQQKMVNNWNAAINSGKWAENVSGVSLADWKRSMIEKGVPRYSQGVQAAVPKMQAFMSKLLPYQETLSAQVQDMPDLTIEDSINRMAAWIRGMSQFRK